MSESLTAAAQEQWAEELRARVKTFKEERLWLRRRVRNATQFWSSGRALSSAADCPCTPCREEHRLRLAILRLLDVVDDAEALRDDWHNYDAGETRGEDEAVHNCAHELAVVIAGEARP